jgi:hypothetical protein
VDFDCTTQETRVLPTLHVKATAGGFVSAVRFWFVAEFGDGLELDSRKAHWRCAGDGRMHDGPIVLSMCVVMILLKTRLKF